MLPKFNIAKKLNIIMLEVACSCLPAIVIAIYFWHLNFIINLLLSIFFALCCEATVLYCRRQNIWQRITDGSALVTAILLAFCISPQASIITLFIANFFAIVVAKQLYGGLGQNIFNPAMLGYLVVLIGLPQQVTIWPILSNIDTINILPAPIIKLFFINKNLIDTVTMATPLDYLQHTKQSMLPFVQTYLSWIYLNLAWLCGGILLLWRRLLDWRIPLTIIASMLFINTIYYFSTESTLINPLLNLFCGNIMMGSFFIASDPVTAPNSKLGIYIYSVCIGVLFFIIRQFSSYPDSIAFAVLFMNMLTPLIDNFTIPQPKIR